MARPKKVGLDYYPMDVGFLRDKKVRLLRTEFGASSVLFVLYVLGKAYEGTGYFLEWDDDEQGFAAEELRQSPTYISEVLRGCLKRSLFDGRVFQMFGVLTSAGIQRRYLRSCEKRAEIRMAEEYWLLDLEDLKDVPAGIRAKLTLFSVSGGKNSVNSPLNRVNSGRNPQSKGKESKGKHSKGEHSKGEKGGPAPSLESESDNFYLTTYRSRCPNLLPLSELTEKRRAAILRFERELRRERFETVCAKANASPFCTGQNDRGWKADFDFLIRPDKATNILEGRYDDKRGGSSDPNSAVQDPAQLERLHQELDWMDTFLREREKDG